MSVKLAPNEPPQSHPSGHHWLGPLRGLGVWQILGHLWREMGQTNVSLLASALAFYGLLATFPALIVVITSFALMAEPSYVAWLMSGLREFLPAEAWGLVSAELKALVSAPNPQIGAGLIIGLAIALWSAHSASASVMEALNRIYGTEEKRGILTYHGLAFALTLGGLCFGLVALGAVAIIPAVIALLPFSPPFAQLLSFIRWPVLALFMMAAFVVLYRYAPCRKEVMWSRVLVGAGVATLLWLIGSALFSIYVGRFGSYDKTYGSLGAVIVLLMWFYVCAHATLLGALVDAEMSRRARHLPRGA